MAKTVKKTVRKKKRERKNIEKGQAHIQSTFNNTLVTLTDMSGNALSWSSADSRVQENQLHSQLRWQLKKQLRVQWNMVLRL